LLKVFSGDRIRLAPIAGDAEAAPKALDASVFRNSAFAVRARIEDKDLSADRWSCVARSEMDSPDAKLQPVLLGRRIPWPSNLQPEPGHKRTEEVLEWTSPAGGAKKLYTTFSK